jgi:hypothetical protein
VRHEIATAPAGASRYARSPVNEQRETKVSLRNLPSSDAVRHEIAAAGYRRLAMTAVVGRGGDVTATTIVQTAPKW